jgi:hypothetical protein
MPNNSAAHLELFVVINYWLQKKPIKLMIGFVFNVLSVNQFTISSYFNFQSSFPSNH